MIIKNLKIDYKESRGVVYKKGIIISNKYEIIQRLFVTVNKYKTGYCTEIIFKHDEIYSTIVSVSGKGYTQEVAILDVIENMILKYENLLEKQKSDAGSLCYAEVGELYHISKIIKRIKNNVKCYRD
jgi:hypothetical protein